MTLSLQLQSRPIQRKVPRLPFLQGQGRQTKSPRKFYRLLMKSNGRGRTLIKKLRLLPMKKVVSRVLILEVFQLWLQ